MAAWILLSVSACSGGKQAAEPETLIAQSHAARQGTYASFGGRGEPGPIRPESPLVGKEFYTCCNLWFDKRGNATDANYPYAAGRFLPAGSHVRVIRVFLNVIFFVADTEPERFSLRLAYGSEHLSFDDYVKAIFLESDPIVGLDQGAQQLVRAATLEVGMTHAQTIAARGYPPRHHTPSLKKDDWIYYQSPGRVKHVRFDGDRVVAVDDAAAP
jgi:hypothetical protein